MRAVAVDFYRVSLLSNRVRGQLADGRRADTHCGGGIVAESFRWRYEYTCGACGNQFEVDEHPDDTPPCPDCGGPDTFELPNMYRCKDCDSEFEVDEPPENPPRCDGCGAIHSIVVSQLGTVV